MTSSSCGDRADRVTFRSEADTAPVYIDEADGDHSEDWRGDYGGDAAAACHMGRHDASATAEDPPNATLAGEFDCGDKMMHGSGDTTEQDDAFSDITSVSDADMSHHDEDIDDPLQVDSAYRFEDERHLHLPPSHSAAEAAMHAFTPESWLRRQVQARSSRRTTPPNRLHFPRQKIFSYGMHSSHGHPHRSVKRSQWPARDSVATAAPPARAAAAAVPDQVEGSSRQSSYVYPHYDPHLHHQVAAKEWESVNRRSLHTTAQEEHLTDLHMQQQCAVPAPSARALPDGTGAKMTMSEGIHPPPLQAQGECDAPPHAYEHFQEVLLSEALQIEMPQGDYQHYDYPGDCCMGSGTEEHDDPRLGIASEHEPELLDVDLESPTRGDDVDYNASSPKEHGQEISLPLARAEESEATEGPPNESCPRSDASLPHDPSPEDGTAPTRNATTEATNRTTSYALRLPSSSMEEASNSDPTPVVVVDLPPSTGGAGAPPPPNATGHLHCASEDSKYQYYACRVDDAQGDRASEIALCTFSRPHMRAFHLAWIAFFVAFFTWFAISPLLSEIKDSLDLTKEEIWTSSICGVAGTALVRIVIGPICDKYGARWSMCGCLVLSAIPTMMIGLVHTGMGLNILRLFIGIAGGSFVVCQYWTSSMFTQEVAGTANALVAGWGNLGGGVTQVVMGSILFPLFKWFYSGTGDEASEKEAAWRTVCIVPGIISIITAFFIVRYSDDSPKGNYKKRSRLGFSPVVKAWSALRTGANEYNTWILFLQYGCCFGVELTMNNAAALYFKDEFGQSTESAAALASIFGWMNLFARGLGGFVSDITNAGHSMRGRLIWLSLSLLLEGILVIVFAHARSLAGAIASMCIFSLFVQAAEGSLYAIVPYVNPSVTGSIAGLVGAGGNVGGIVFAIFFREFDYFLAFTSMGLVVVCSSALSLCVHINGYGRVCGGKDSHAVLEHRAVQVERMRQALENSANRRPSLVGSTIMSIDQRRSSITSDSRRLSYIDSSRRHSEGREGKTQVQTRSNDDRKRDSVNKDKTLHASNKALSFSSDA